MNSGDRQMNLRLAMQPLAAALCLVGFSDQTGSGWMMVPAAFLAVYAVLFPANFVSVLASRAFWKGLATAAVRVALFALAFAGACVLANGGPVLGIAGSLVLIGLLLTAAAVFVSLIFRFVPPLTATAIRLLGNRVRATGDLTVLLRATLVA